jgi:RHS repeat-associated protein
MAAAEAAKQAARMTDPVEHGLGMLGMLAGLVLGAVVGAVLVAATVATGGAALAVAIAVVGAVGVTAGAGLAGGQLAHGLSTLMGCSGITTGAILPACSLDVIMGNLPAARAQLDGAVCNGLFAVNHFPMPLALIATGSSNVFINKMPAARQSDKLVCGADIETGLSSVLVGGGTVQVLPIDDAEAALRDLLGKVALASLVGVALLLGGGFLAGAICGAAVLEFVAVGVAFFAGNEVLGLIGDQLGPGWRDTLQGGFGIASTMFAGAKGLRSIETGRPIIGEPVDGVTGEVCMWKTDFTLPGALELTLKRSYASGLEQGGCFGAKWRSTWGQWAEAVGGVVTFNAADGRSIEFDAPLDAAGEWIANPLVNQLRLRRVAEGFEVRDEQRRTLRFAERAGARWLLSAIEDANGNAILFTYDKTGALREVVHTGGYRLKVEGTASQIERVSLLADEGEIELIRYEYDEGGRLAAVIDGSGLPFRYFYDDAGRVTRWEDRNGVWYQYRYDARGRCIEALGPERMYHYRFTYDEAARVNTAIDSLGGVTTFVYNERLQVIEQRDPEGGVTRSEWDERSNKLRETDPAGRGWTHEYDDDGNLTSVTDGLGRTTRVLWNEQGLAEKLIDAGGQSWRRAYDERGNIVTVRGPDGATWRYERDALGNMVTAIDPRGHPRRFGYDARGLTEWAEDAKGRRSWMSRDALGRLTERTDALEARTLFRYNALGKLAETELPDGARMQWEYDAEGNLARRIGRDGQAFSYEYGPFDLLTKVHKPSGAALELRYNTEARLTSVENELGQVWRYVYNGAGRIIEEQDFHGRRQAFEYDGSGMCVKRVNGLGEAIELERDAVGQLTRKRSSAGEAQFEYDALGRLTRAVNQSGDTQFERDNYGRVVRETQHGHVIDSEYDARGLRVKRRSVGGHEWEWNWDENGQVSAVREADEQLLAFVRDAGGRVVERRMRGGLVVRQDYDAMDRLVSQWAGMEASDAPALVERRFDYDLNGDPIEIRDRHWGASRFAYDPDGRIATASNERAASEEFRYDNAGNIADQSGVFGLKTRFYGQDGRLERAGQTSYLWDADGRLVEQQQDGRKWRYEWSPEGQLRSVRTPEGRRWRYEYDAIGRRIRKSGPSGKTTYVWDGNVVSEEIREDHTSSAWVYEPGGFRPLLKQEGKQTYACITDQVGAPRELVSADGKMAWSARLSAWGELAGAGEKNTECSIRFQGQWFDAESGLHYNWHRYYEPEVGQYLSPDPIGIQGGTRTYGYVHNPLSWADPLGLAGCGDSETYYRTMSQSHYDQLVATGKLPPTSETFTSPTQSFSEDYQGVLVKFNMEPGTTNSLEGIGVRDNSAAARSAYPDMPGVSKGWTSENAFFKGEGDQVNIGLGKGKALDTFHSNIKSFDKVR